MTSFKGVSKPQEIVVRYIDIILEEIHSLQSHTANYNGIMLRITAGNITGAFPLVVVCGGGPEDSDAISRSMYCLNTSVQRPVSHSS